MSLDLKELKLSHEQIDTDRLFQSSGVETAKAQDPCDFRLKLIGFRLNEDDDRRDLYSW